MIKVNFNIDDDTQSFDVPENWDEVTVEQFMELVELQKEAKEEVNPLTTIIKMVHIMTGIPMDIVEMVPVDQFHLIQDTLQYTKEEVNIEKKDYVEIDGDTYWVKNDFNKLTMGETITIETLVKDAPNDNVMNVFDKLLTVFLRKKTKKGNLESFKSSFLDERVEIFRRLPISQVYAIMVFFSDGGNGLEVPTNPYLENQK
jgi:hypothetical protein